MWLSGCGWRTNSLQPLLSSIFCFCFCLLVFCLECQEICLYEKRERCLYESRTTSSTFLPWSILFRSFFFYFQSPAFFLLWLPNFDRPPDMSPNTYGMEYVYLEILRYLPKILQVQAVLMLLGGCEIATGVPTVDIPFCQRNRVTLKC